MLGWTLCLSLFYVLFQLTLQLQSLIVQHGDLYSRSRCFRGALAFACRSSSSFFHSPRQRSLILYVQIILPVEFSSRLTSMTSVMTNNPSGNEVVVSSLASTGKATFVKTVATGGKGAVGNNGGGADGLFSQDSVLVKYDNLFVVNVSRTWFQPCATAYGILGMSAGIQHPFGVLSRPLQPNIRQAARKTHQHVRRGAYHSSFM